MSLAGVRKAALFGSSVLKYLLRATFDTGDQGYANGQVLDTPGEGVQAGQLTVVEVDGTLAVSGNKCAFTAQSTPAWGDLGFYSQAITRALGRGLLGMVNQSGAIEDWIAAWVDSTGIGINDFIYMLSMSPASGSEGRMFVFDGNGNQLEMVVFASTLSTGTDYQFAIILGGYDSSGIPWTAGQPAASYLLGAACFVKGGSLANWTLIWRSGFLNTATLYACATSQDAVCTLDNFRVPDCDLSAVLQPTALSTCTAANGTSLDAITPEVGGVWTEQSGDWEIQSNQAKAAASGGAGIATISTGLADLLYDVKVTMPASGTTAGGLIVRFTDTSNFWYIRITPGTAGTDLELVEVNAGTPTTRASADIDWVASTAYNLRVIVAGNDYWKVCVDSEEKLTYTTTNTFNQTATVHGLRDEGNANFTGFDNAAAFARTAAVYDATLNKV